MKKYQVFLLFVALSLVVFSCSQPKAPTGTPGPKSAPEATESVAADSEEAVAEAEKTAEAAAEEAQDVGEVEVAEATETAETAGETPAAAVETNKEDVDAGEPAVEGGVPKLVVPERIYDFGSMRDTETLVHDFILRNEGTGVLEIKNVRASCGCTTTELEKDKLDPGEEIKINAKVNLSGRQGKQVKAVTVTTNDPETASVQLRMEGMVTASINADPDRVNFGEIRDDDPREAVVNITSTVDDLSFAVQSAEVKGMEFIEHEIEEVEPGKAYKLVIKTTGDLPVGHHNGRMIIRTDSKVRPIIFMNISMQVIGPLQIMPPVIHIRHSEDPDAVTSQQLRISPGRVEEFEITEVVVPVDQIKATLTPQADNIYLLRLENMPSSADILEDKSVILRTNLEAYKEVPIPFNVAKLRVQARPAGKMPRKIMELTPEQKAKMREHALSHRQKKQNAKTAEEAEPAEGAAPAVE